VWQGFILANGPKARKSDEDVNRHSSIQGRRSYLVKRISQRVPSLSRQTGTHCILEQWVPRKRRMTRY